MCIYIRVECFAGHRGWRRREAGPEHPNIRADAGGRRQDPQVPRGESGPFRRLPRGLLSHERRL